MTPQRFGGHASAQPLAPVSGPQPERLRRLVACLALATVVGCSAGDGQDDTSAVAEGGVKASSVPQGRPSTSASGLPSAAVNRPVSPQAQAPAPAPAPVAQPTPAPGTTTGNGALLSGLVVGIGSHMGQAGDSGNSRQSVEAVAAAAADLGVKSLRDEIYWGDFENPQYTFAMYNATPQMRESITSGLFADGMLALGYGNRFYSDGAMPTTLEARTAYARYANELARATADTVRYYEVWNEWNLTGTASDYIALARSAIPAVRAGAPRGTILVGGIADPESDDWAFVRAMLADGVLSAADGLSVHLYNYSQGANATSQELIRRLETLQQILTAGNGGRPYPVYVTELGWPTQVGTTGVSEALSGAFIARFLLEAQGYDWLKGVWLYELFNTSDTASTDRESNFGLYRTTGQRKAGTCHVASALAMSKTHRYVGKGVTGSVRWMQFEGNGRTVFVQFAERAADSFSLRLASRPVSLCDWDPTGSTPSAPATYSIGALPVVVTYPGVGLNGATVLAQ